MERCCSDETKPARSPSCPRADRYMRNSRPGPGVDSSLYVVGARLYGVSFRVLAAHEVIHEAVHVFGENEIPLIAEECTERERFPKDFLSQVAKYDLVALAVPKIYIVVSIGTLVKLLITEELWRAKGSAAQSSQRGSALRCSCSMATSE